MKALQQQVQELYVKPATPTTTTPPAPTMSTPTSSQHASFNILIKVPTNYNTTGILIGILIDTTSAYLIVVMQCAGGCIR